jgi:hypothetical protein
MRELRTSLVILALAAAAAGADAQVIPIAAARSQPLGSVVTVEGSVTVPPGAFSSSTFDQGFTLQDATGGIYVALADHLDLKLRRVVRVTGTLADNGSGVLTIVPATAGDVEADGRSGRLEPRWVPTGSIGEATEGLLVQVVGTITGPIVPDPPYGTILNIDDGSGPIRIFVCTSTGIHLGALAPGQQVSVTGMSYQFLDYEVDPRLQGDIHRRE